MRLARLNLQLARVQADLQEPLARPTKVQEDPLQKARGVLAELRVKEKRLAEQRMAAIQAALGELRRLGFGPGETSARPPRDDGFPDFPWPPPNPSGMETIPAKFYKIPCEPNCLGDIDKRLCGALNRCGYFDLRYFAVRDGFALVTRVEQINADGTPKPGKERFVDGPVFPGGRMSFTEYLRALFLARPGYYRIIVFIVTPHSFAPSDETISRKQAEAWFTRGGPALPEEIAALKWTAACKCTSLIYEFEQPNPGVLITPRVPGRHQCREHLMAAGLWNALLEVHP